MGQVRTNGIEVMARTLDDARGLAVHTTGALGLKQALTPEGFLLCEDVPLARPGEMIYGPDETPIEAGPDGITHITRTLDELLETL